MIKIERIMCRLLAEHLINVNDVDYLRYTAVIDALGLSPAIAQLRRRKERHPMDFIQINHKPYISLDYAQRIIVQRIKEQKGGSHD